MSDIRSLIEKLEEINESTEIERAIKRGVDQLSANPTIADIEAGANNAAKEIRAQLQSRDDDSFFQGIGRGAMRFGTSVDYIKSQFLGYTAQKLKLPGLYSMPDGKSFVTSDKDGLRFKVVRFADMNDAAKLYQAGYVTPAKAKELQVQNKNNPVFKEPPGPKANNVDGTRGNSSSVATAYPVPDPEPSKASVTNVTASTSVNKLIQDLNKELTALKQGFPEFFESIKHAGMYLKEDAYPNAKKISQIIQQLNDLRDQADDESKTKIDQALNSIPQKFTKDWIAKKVAQDGYPALYGLKPKTAPAADANADASVAAPAASNTATSKGQSANKKITWQDLVKLNPEIKDPNKIYPGQEIKLPNGSSAVVDQGDTLSGIAQRWNQGGYNDELDAVDNAPQSSGTSTAPAAPSTAPSATPAPVPSSSTGATVPITPEITSRAKKLNRAIGMLGIDAGAVDNVFKSIPNKETFLAVSQEYKRISGKDLIRELNGSWTHKAELVVNPLLKKWGIPPLAEQNEVLNLFSRMENYK
jgi:LysM repeat protein